MDMLVEPAPLAGRMPTVPDGLRIYAIGDVHGRLDLLRQIEAQIEADARSAGAMRIVQVMLGDYVDRGPDSRGVIEHLRVESQGRQIVALRGNHEVYILDMQPQTFPRWCRLGGRETLLSYGLDLSGFDETAVEACAPELIERAREVVPQDHMAFLAATQLTWRCGDYFFVHAGLRPAVPLAAQDPHDLIWIREEFLDDDEDRGLVVVHGHTPTPAPVIKPNRIGIDTRAYASGVLTCLVLEGTQRRFLATA